MKELVLFIPVELMKEMVEAVFAAIGTIPACNESFHSRFAEFFVLVENGPVGSSYGV
ncbi:unnamed protein product, partial [marine sediment metagenome]